MRFQSGPAVMWGKHDHDHLLSFILSKIKPRSCGFCLTIARSIRLALVEWVIALSRRSYRVPAINRDARISSKLSLYSYRLHGRRSIYG